MSYLPKEVRRWVTEYPDDTKIRVRLKNLADTIERLEADAADRSRIVLTIIDEYDLESNEALQADMADRIRAVLDDGYVKQK